MYTPFMQLSGSLLETYFFAPKHLDGCMTSPLKGRISLLPKIPSEASYFWRDPVPNREGLCVINNAG